MNELQKHQFAALCEAVYRKERDGMREQDECAMPAGMSTMTANAPTMQAEPAVTLRRGTLRMAIRQAEQACDEIIARLHDAEGQRDSLARQLGSQQDIVDRLKSEKEARSRHIRDLVAARDS